MILVPNPRPRLNGNKGLFLLLILSAWIFQISCSSQKMDQKEGSYSLVDKGLGNNYDPFSSAQIQHFTSGKGNESVANLALLLPLNLNSMGSDPNSASLHNTIENNALVWDFYQGFVLGLDSVGRYNQDHGIKGIDLQVMDTGEDSLVLNQILMGGPLDPMDIVIGPLYPSQIKQVSHYAIQKKKFFVSPISPQPLTNFNNPYLIMMNSPLEAYSQKTVEFIQDHYPVANVLILDNSSQDLSYYGSMVSHFNHPPKLIKININQIGTEKIPLSQSLPNILIVPSLDKAFWSKLVVYLGSLNPSFQLNVFAHPNFPRLNFIDQDLLQNLHIHYPANYLIDKDDPAAVQMQALYKSRFQTNPSQYSYLGYDMGFYFGKSLTSGDSLQVSLNSFDWKGIHNDFHFTHDPKLGYQNTSIKMLEYINNTLQEAK